MDLKYITKKSSIYGTPFQQTLCSFQLCQNGESLFNKNESWKSLLYSRRTYDSNAQKLQKLATHKLKNLSKKFSMLTV